VAPSTIVILAGLGVITLAALAAIMRPLVLASLQPELAGARGVSLRLVSMAFLAIGSLAVSECAQIVGVLLVFTLMVGPPAAAHCVTTRVWTGLLLSAVLALAEAWCGIVTAYYTDWPVSFCIATLSALGYFSCRSLDTPRLRAMRHRELLTPLASPAPTPRRTRARAE
jgi:zinc/manganese transport system permease protein